MTNMSHMNSLRNLPVIPPFEPDGLLPPGGFELSFDELRKSLLVGGPDNQETTSTWEMPWLTLLLQNLAIHM